MHGEEMIAADAFTSMWSDLSASSLGARVNGLMDMARWQADSPAVSLFQIRANGRHSLIHNSGYPANVVTYLSEGFVRNCDGFAQVQRRPDVAHDWDRLHQFRNTISAQQYFIPAGYHNGVSLMLTQNDDSVGVFHFAAKQNFIEDHTFRMLEAIRPVFGEYTAMINRYSEAELTPREIDVVSEVRRGKSNLEIAASLFISAKTVASHLERILRKLSLENRTQVALFAERLGLG